MTLWDENDIDYPITVSVSRPENIFDDKGDFTRSLQTVIESMTADIQLSLKVRKLIAEDETGISDNAVWIMYCNPAETILCGDRVSDGTSSFLVEAVGDWGSHVECVMRKVDV
jgi:hypothetical protein